MSASPEQFFSASWSAYQKILIANYMRHAEITSLYRRELIQLEGPLKILDLGCGDAFMLLLALDKSDITSYTGIDLSAPALSLAKENLEKRRISHSLLQGAMEEKITGTATNYQVIHLGYSLHHLPDNAKKKMLQAAVARLAPGGMILLADIFRKEGMNRDEYIQSYFSRMDYWHTLSATQLQQVKAHMQQADFPCTITEATNWMRDAGLDVEILPLEDTHHQALRGRVGIC